MSHFTDIETRIADVDALSDACTELGVELEHHATARGYGTNTHKGEYVIRLKGPYDIALNRQSDGFFCLTADRWQGYVEKEVGQNFGRLLQLYGTHKVTRDARRKGYHVNRSMCNGSIVLQIGAAA